MRRLAITPAQLRNLLDVLSAFGFAAKRVEVTPAGAVILHADGAAEPERDLLSEWEAARARKTH